MLVSILSTTNVAIGRALPACDYCNCFIIWHCEYALLSHGVRILVEKVYCCNFTN